jgi:acyl-CoA dehydrogenase
MTTTTEDRFEQIRDAVRAISRKYPHSYWKGLEVDGAYPADYVSEMIAAGFAGTMIPQEYGGLGLGIAEASVIVEEMSRQGGSGHAIHAEMFASEIIRQSGSDAQRSAILPKVSDGSLRLQAFAITEPDVGTDTTRIRTRAIRSGEGYKISGQKVFISRAANTDLMLVLARTTPLEECVKRVDGLSIFVFDVRDKIGNGMTLRRIPLMFNHHTYEVFFDDVEVPSTALVGEEGRGFRYLLAGLNAERILTSAESVGDGRYFVERAIKYAKERIVFGRPIGANQGVQFPIARAHINVEAADLMRWRAVELFDRGEPCGAEANMAKLLSSEAACEAANTAFQTYGGYAVAAEYDIERKFREVRHQLVAPVSTNMVFNYIGSHVLGMPRSY